MTVFQPLARLVAAYVLLCTALPILSRLIVPSCASVTTLHDIAVILGSGIHPGGQLTPDSATRVAAGVALYQRGLVTGLHLTGGGAAQEGTSIGAAMARDARAARVPADRVTFEGESRSTLENALFSLPFLSDADSIIVVTEPFHALRGGASFAWAGRPSTICKSPIGTPGPARWLRDQAWETGGWGLNLIRAPLWSLTRAAGRPDLLPDGFLH